MNELMVLAGEIAKKDPDFAKSIGEQLAAALLEAEEEVDRH